MKYSIQWKCRGCGHTETHRVRVPADAERAPATETLCCEKPDLAHHRDIRSYASGEKR